VAAAAFGGQHRGGRGVPASDVAPGRYPGYPTASPSLRPAGSASRVPAPGAADDGGNSGGSGGPGVLDNLGKSMSTMGAEARRRFATLAARFNRNTNTSSSGSGGSGNTGAAGGPPRAMGSGTPSGSSGRGARASSGGGGILGGFSLGDSRGAYASLPVENSEGGPGGGGGNQVEIELRTPSAAVASSRAAFGPTATEGGGHAGAAPGQGQPTNAGLFAIDDEDEEDGDTVALTRSKHI
jgi:hypothetical protein